MLSATQRCLWLCGSMGVWFTHSALSPGLCSPHHGMLLGWDMPRTPATASWQEGPLERPASPLPRAAVLCGSAWCLLVALSHSPAWGRPRLHLLWPGVRGAHRSHDLPASLSFAVTDTPRFVPVTDGWRPFEGIRPPCVPSELSDNMDVCLRARCLSRR